jgi:hypothetical protein
MRNLVAFKEFKIPQNWGIERQRRIFKTPQTSSRRNSGILQEKFGQKVESQGISYHGKSDLLCEFLCLL